MAVVCGTNHPLISCRMPSAPRCCRSPIRLGLVTYRRVRLCRGWPTRAGIWLLNRLSTGYCAAKTSWLTDALSENRKSAPSPASRRHRDRRVQGSSQATLADDRGQTVGGLPAGALLNRRQQSRLYIHLAKLPQSLHAAIISNHQAPDSIGASLAGTAAPIFLDAR